MSELPILIPELRAAYRAGRFTPVEYCERLIERSDEGNVWTHALSREQVLAYARALLGRSIDELPLYGVPFAIKDNIDLANVPTTAGCPEFARTPSESAFVVQRLIDAGAVPIGKTNLDQFATGLVGVRSPFGACANPFAPEFISGGSSSGSAVAVARGWVSFALGTDTAGSGRVPAAFNNIVGLKPSCGRLSARGVVPACRSLDCVSIFALSAGDARSVFQVASGYDASDAYSRDYAASVPIRGRRARIGVPRADQREFFGDREYERLYAEAVQLARDEHDIVEIDLAPFLAAARLLYEGPWVAERYAAVGEFIERHEGSVDPVVAKIVLGGRDLTAAHAFEVQYRLMELKRETAGVWRDIDTLLLPTAPTIHRIGDVRRDPIRLNSQLGHYTNFVNLLDLAAVAVPAGRRSDGLPFGITFIAPAGADERLLDLAARLHPRAARGCGTMDVPIPAAQALQAIEPGYVPIVVCGAHMQGLPLNRQLLERGAYFVETTKTSAAYRFYALAGGPPARPGLIRVDAGGGQVDVEVWAMPAQHFGSFMVGVPAPLGIGKVELADGRWCPGFVCEGYAASTARDITALGGWRQYLAQAANP